MARPLLLLLLLLLVLGSLVSCRPPAAPRRDSLTFARAADTQKLDPADVDDGESVKVLAQVGEGLVRFKPGTAEIAPCLATAWTVSADGLVYTFTLRPGVKFHDGTPLTAEAALFTFRRQMETNHPGHFAEANFAYWSAMYGMVQSVRALDPATLEFRLTAPHAPFLANLAIFPAFLVSPHTANQRQPIGTGPFRFVEWVPNERIVLDWNPDYWDGPPALARLTFKVVPDNAARLIQLQAGQVDAIDGVDPNDLPVIRRDASLQLVDGAGLNVAYLAFQCETPPLTDRNLRRAIAAAINKQDLVANIYRGAGEVARNPLPPLIPGHNNAIPVTVAAPVTFTPPTQPIELHVMTNPRPYLPNPVRAAEMIKADCARIGVPIQIVANEWGSHLSRTSRGEHQLALLGWVGDNADADNFLYVLLDKDTATLGSALNVCFWKNDPYHELMQAARRELDPARRAELYRQAQAMIAEEVPMVPLAHARSLAAARRSVTGLAFELNGDLLFHHVQIAP